MPSNASEINICNMALTWLGEDEITSLEDNNTRARLCKLNYPRVRDAVLEDREWTFAVKRYTLAPDATPPEFDYSQRFKIPSEVLRVLTVDRENISNPDQLTYNIIEREQAKWVREGQYILADIETAYVRAIVRVTNTGEYGETFVHAVAARLASELAVPIVRSRAMAEQMYALYRQKLDDAIAVDGMQGRSKRIRSRYLSARR